MASAYEEKKNNEILEREKHQKTFSISIGILSLAALFPVSLSIYNLAKGYSIIETIKGTPEIILVMLPLYLPLIWIASKSSKNEKLSKRLIEEYTHKATLNKTYYGLSQQIEKIEEQEMSKDLSTKLLYHVLEMSGENPGKLISDYSNNDHPVMDAIDKSIKLTNSLDKLSRIPGFATIAENLDKRAKHIQEAKAKAVESALSTEKTPESEEGAFTRGSGEGKRTPADILFDNTKPN